MPVHQRAHGTARGVARVYAALISRTAIVDPAALKKASAEQVYGHDLVLHRPSRRWQNPRTRALIDAVYACL